LRILFTTIRSDELVNLNVIHSLEKEVSKHADCQWVGKGWRDHRPGEKLNESIKRLYGNDPPDWVVSNRADLKEYKAYGSPRSDRPYGMVMTLADLHVDPQEWVRGANNGYDVTLMRYLYSPYVKKSLLGRYRYYQKIDPEFYVKNLTTKIHHFPWFTDPSIYKPSSEKEYDVVFLGSSEKKVYPLRNAIVRDLPRLCKEKGWRYMLKGRPPGETTQRNISELLNQGYVVGERYAETIARSKVFIFGSSIFRYPLSKYFEVMGSGALVMADEPQTAQQLHLKDRENYVRVSKENWKNTLEYYLENDEERERIASKGYDTVMKYHSVAVRAKELVDLLNKPVA